MAAYFFYETMRTAIVSYLLKSIGQCAFLVILIDALLVERGKNIFMSMTATFSIPFTHLDNVSLEALWYGFVVVINKQVRSPYMSFVKYI